VFGADGALSRAIPGFRMRRQQIEMAQAIAQAMRDNSLLVAEAGTGTGKTFAYLVPALLSGGKVIISTGTKNLQDQLYNRDLPRCATPCRFRSARRCSRGGPITSATITSRARSKTGASPAARTWRICTRSRASPKTTKSGDRAELADVPENASAWQAATSTRENCLGQDCRQYKECFVMAARREALNADIVVVNHHLFFADVMLKDEGMAELLPACNAVIFDEAHQLPETATLFFRRKPELGPAARPVPRHAGGGDRRRRRRTRAAPGRSGRRKSQRDVRLALPLDVARLSYAVATAKAAFKEALVVLEDRLKQLAKLLEAQAQRGEGLENCWRRRARSACPARTLARRGVRGHGALDRNYSSSFQLNAAPLDIAEIFRKQLQGHPRAGYSPLRPSQ